MTSSGERDVSVVMPVRHAHAHVDDAIRSILAQRLSPLELLVVDDHADRATRARLTAWRRADARVRLVDVRGSGLVDALNTGLWAARGPLIARMDADDVAHPDRLLLQRAFWRTRSDVTVVSCYVESFPRSELGEGYRIYERWLNALREPAEIAREIFVESPMAHPSVLFDRRAVIDAGGYLDDGGPEDYELWLRLHAAGHRFAKVRAVLHYWRDHPSRLSRVDARYARDRFIDTKARYLARMLAGRRAIVWGAGRVGRRLARGLLAREVGIDAFVDIDPRKIGRIKHGRPVLAPEAVPAAGDGVVVLAAVGSRHARELIRGRLRRAGYVEGRSFWAAA